METLPQLLQKIAKNHLENKTRAYIEQLENVAKIAQEVAKKLPESREVLEPKKALEDLDVA